MLGKSPGEPGKSPGYEPTVRSVTCRRLYLAIILPVRRNYLLLPVIILLLAACAPDQSRSETAVPTALELDQAPDQAQIEEPATAAPSPTLAQAATFPPPTVEEEPTSSAEPATPTSPPATPDPQPISGQTADGAFFLGAPDAALTIIDYSDFL